MKPFPIPALRHTAEQSLAASKFPHRRVALLYTGILVGLTILLGAIDVLLGIQTDKIEGLSGLRLRNLLTTVRTIAALLPVVLTPFWKTGYISYTMEVINRRETSYSSLKAGFSVWSKVITCGLLKVLPVVAVGYGLYTFLGTAYLLAFGDVDTLLTIADTGTVPEELFLPMMLILLCAAGAAAAFFGFRFRLVSYCLLDQPNVSALSILRRANSLMKGRMGGFLRLDLHFWWYWALELLAQVLLYLDVILPLFQISLPFSPLAAYFLCYGLWAAAELAISWFALNGVSCTYAAAYEATAAANPIPIVPAPPVQRYDWN